MSVVRYVNSLGWFGIACPRIVCILVVEEILRCWLWWNVLKCCILTYKNSVILIIRDFPNINMHVCMYVYCLFTDTLEISNTE